MRGSVTPGWTGWRWSRSPVEGFEVEVDRAATREAHRERLVVGVAEGDDAAFTLAFEHLEGRGDHRALDAAARHRPCDLALVVDGHGRTRVARCGTLQCDDARHRDPVPVGPPALDVVQHFLHVRSAPFGEVLSPETTCARCSSDARLCPSTNSSTCGRAAAIPRASGAKFGDDFSGFTHTTWYATRCSRSIWSP